MKKYIFVFTLFFINLTSIAQTKYITRTGLVEFEASVPSFEEVKATNNSATAIIDTSNGEFAALVLIKGFRFKNALMEEHFNENYAESDTYPKSVFKGKIEDFNSLNLKKESIKQQITGELTFHGKTKDLKDLDLSISKNENIITMTGSFEVNVSDFEIDIPSVVSNKLSKTVTVDFEFILNKK